VGTTTTAGTIRYTNGTALDAIYVVDSALTFYEGIGVVWPYGMNFFPRVWNGTIRYCVAPVAVSSLESNVDEVKHNFNSLQEQILVEVTTEQFAKYQGAEICLHDAYGRKVLQSNLMEGQSFYSTASLAKGLYVLSIRKGNSVLKQNKLMIY
jgi:hypothetical protein